METISVGDISSQVDVSEASPQSVPAKMVSLYAPDELSVPPIPRVTGELFPSPTLPMA